MRNDISNFVKTWVSTKLKFMVDWNNEKCFKSDSGSVALKNNTRGTVLEWVRTCESGSESESTRPESESIRCESESIGPESESESIRPESESESSGSESESKSASPTEVRVSPDLSPDSAWTHESNNRKVLCFNPTFNHFCWALYCDPNFPFFYVKVARLAKSMI